MIAAVTEPFGAKGNLMCTPINRREFLAAGAGAAAAMLTPPARANAGDRIRCGVIGVGSRGTYLMQLAMNVKDVDIVAVCDIAEPAVKRARDIVAKARGKSPDGYGNKGPTDYRRMLERKDLDAVIITTPIDLHAPMAIDALRAGKAVLSEVAAATTMDDCRDLARAVEETRGFYMMAENVCYFRDCMMVLNMVQQGLFGESFTYAECGYVHDCRSLIFKPDGTLTWRGERMCRDVTGNRYPTHAIGPVAQWMGINKTDRFVSLVSMSSRPFGARQYAIRQFGKDSPQARIDFQGGDTNTTLIRTAKGAVIDLRYDIASPRPHKSTVYHSLQGEKAAYQSLTGEVWIDGKSEKYEWEPVAKYARQYDHPYWQKWGKDAEQTGHGGADFFVIQEFFDALRAGKRPPIDVYDAVTWSCIIPLSAESIRKGSVPVEMPDFTKNAKA
jgi:predicted dehydrogenase